MSTIIFLNGTSSSGKTTLLKALQKKLQEPYLDMGIDKFIWMLPGRYLDRPLWDEILGKALQSGPLGLTLFSGMHHAIAATAQRGNNILADHVFVEKVWVDECASLFAEMNAYLIGVKCPLEVVEQREADRKDRTLGQARLQYDVIHKYVKYDLEVDTSLLSTEECVEKVIERLKSPPTAFKSLQIPKADKSISPLRGWVIDFSILSIILSLLRSSLSSPDIIQKSSTGSLRLCFKKNNNSSKKK